MVWINVSFFIVFICKFIMEHYVKFVIQYEERNQIEKITGFFYK